MLWKAYLRLIGVPWNLWIYNRKETRKFVILKFQVNSVSIMENQNLFYDLSFWCYIFGSGVFKSSKT